MSLKRLHMNEAMYQQYARDPRRVHKKEELQNKSTSSRFSVNIGQNPPNRNGNPRRCFKCGSTKHFKSQCKPGSIRNHVQSRLLDGTPAGHVITELVQGMEEEIDDSEDTEIGGRPSAVFDEPLYTNADEETLHMLNTLN